MDDALRRDWGAIFALAAEARAEKRREERMRVFYADLDRERVHKLKAEEKREKDQKAVEEALATATQSAAFNEHLDAYDTATVHALMENGEAMDRVREGLRRMEENAVTLPDGRRVFKSIDGQRVFDEHGAAVPAETIDPHAIGDQHTTWELYRASKSEEVKLGAESPFENYG